MHRKWMGWYSVVALAFWIAPLVVLAQEGSRRERGDIQVTNDWEQTVKVTLWKERGGQMSRRTWTIPQGQSAVLAGEDGRSLRVGGSDKIKVGDDWGRVDIRHVGQLQGGLWNVSVRNIWQATHQRRGRSGLPPDQPGTALPPDRR
jgi:hypothetical protein